MTRATSFAAVLLLVQCCSSGESSDRVPDAQSGSVGRWEQSFKAGDVDASGRLVGGTEIIHLESHKGRLYAGNGYWMDTAGKAQMPWAQVLVLDSPEGSWKVDLALGPRHLRVTILKSVTFNTDGNGAALDVPVSLLLAGSDHHEVGKAPVYRETNIWTRDDDENTWVKTTLQSGKRHRRSVRALLVHRDRKTGMDRIFVAAGALGIYSGMYDADKPGKIRWDKKPELGPLAIRPMSFAEANGSIYASAGTSVYRRSDGPSPQWVKVYSDDTPEHWELGGIRGLTAVPSPTGVGESLLFSHTNRIIRVDPANSDKATIELKIGELLARNWGRRITGAIIAAYTDVLPLTDPATGQTVHIMGVQGRASGRPTFGGWYPGGSYLIRSADRSYRLKEVNGRWKPGNPMLVAVRTYALSPFPEEAGNYVYFGGFDANFRDAHNTAWIFRALVETVLTCDP